MQEGALIDAAGRGGKASTSAAKAGRKQAAYVGAEPVSAQHLRPSVAEPDAARASRYAQMDMHSAGHFIVHSMAGSVRQGSIYSQYAASTEDAVLYHVVHSVGDLGGSQFSKIPLLQFGTDVAAESGERRVPKTLQWQA